MKEAKDRSEHIVVFGGQWKEGHKTVAVIESGADDVECFSVLWRKGWGGGVQRYRG